MSMQHSHPDTPKASTTLAAAQWRRFFQPPTDLTELGEQRQAQFLLVLSLAFFIASTIGAIFAVPKYVFLMLLIASGLAVGLSRTRYYQLGSALIIAVLTFLTLVRTVDNVLAPLFFLPLTFVLASVLFSYRPAAVAILGNLAAPLLLPFFTTVTFNELMQSLGTLSVVGLLFIFTTLFRNNLERDRLKLLTETNDELEILRADLGNQVQSRTAELALAAEVGRTLSQVRTLDTLLKDASELIREQFNLYHVQIYLVDSSQKNLILRAGTGQAAKEMLRRSHNLKIGSDSINGSAALNKKPFIVSNVHQSSLFRPNLLLPNTRSEMAVPLLSGGRVLGVLDLQSSATNGLTEGLLPVFEAVASQLAVSIDNANLFTAATQAQTEVEAYLQRLAGEGWANYLDGINREEKLAYVYDTHEAAAESDDDLTPTSANKNVLELPITVANEPIGTIQVEAEDGRRWTESSHSLVASVAQQVAQQVENLRLLDEAQQYRMEAENAVQRLTRDEWRAYQEQVAQPGFVYDGIEVKPLTTEHDAEAISDQVVSLPLQVHGEQIGQIVLDGLAEVDDERQALLTAVAHQLSDHIESLRLAQQTELALAQTDRLYKIGNAFNAANNVQEILEAAVTPVQQEGIHEATLMFVELDGRGEPEALEMLADWRLQGSPSFPKGTQFPLNQFPFASLFMGSPQETQFISNVADDERVDEFTKGVMLQVGIQALVVVPLTIAGQWVGILTFGWTSPHRFSQQSKEFFNALIHMAAPVVQSQRLYTQTRKQAEKERLINLISQKIQGTVTMKGALETAVKELGQALQTTTNVKLNAFTEKTEADRLKVEDSVVSSVNGGSHQ